MIAAVNLLWCRPGKVGGSEEYLARQLLGLHGVAPDITTRLVVPPGFAQAHDELAVADLRTGPAWTTGRTGRLAAELAWLPQQLCGAALVHHGGGTVPPRSPRPIVLTVHDLQYRTFPQYFSQVRRRYLATTMPRSARRASVITVPSEFVKSTVVEAYGVDHERIVVVPHGVDPPPQPATDAADLRRRYRLGDRRVVIFPAITHPHKGHRFLVDVAARSWPDDVALVLVGGEGAAESAVQQAIAASGAADRIVRPGRVPAADRDGLIALAEVLAFPSEYEGFGAPVLEAMALGTPVICSDRAALPEVVGAAAVVMPLDAAAWAGALDAVAADRDGWIERGRARALRFSTAASGAALAGAYRLAVTSG